MIVCKNCNVELDDGMSFCPLCGDRVTGQGQAQMPASGSLQPFHYGGTMSLPQKKFTWEIVSIILLSGIIATFVINYIINKRITWSEYPIAISLVIFSYISLFAFWHKRTIIQMAGSFILSSFFLLMLDILTNGIRWSVKLAIPLLLVGNLVTVATIAVIRRSKDRGINVIAYIFLGVALICICVDAILTAFKTNLFHVEWSIIVACCIIPVVLVLLFVHFRLKKGRSLEKTFHV
jgi:hypothetical protein